jgi:hypothetical protein
MTDKKKSIDLEEQRWASQLRKKNNKQKSRDNRKKEKEKLKDFTKYYK